MSYGEHSVSGEKQRSDELVFLICLVIVCGIVGMTAIIANAVTTETDREWQDAFKCPVVTLDELVAYNGYKLDETRDDLGVARLIGKVTNRHGVEDINEVYVHMDYPTYNLVKGWSEVKYAELKRIAAEAGKVPVAETQTDSKR